MIYTLKLGGKKGGGVVVGRAHMHGFSCGQRCGPLTLWNSQLNSVVWVFQVWCKWVRMRGSLWVQLQWGESAQATLHPTSDVSPKELSHDMSPSKHHYWCWNVFTMTCRTHSAINLLPQPWACLVCNVRVLRWAENRPRGTLWTGWLSFSPKFTDLCSFWFEGWFFQNASGRHSKINFLDTLQGRCVCIHFPMTGLTAGVSIFQGTIKTRLSQRKHERNRKEESQWTVRRQKHWVFLSEMTT